MKRTAADRAARMVALVIGAGLVVKVRGDVGDFTAGPYQRAVGSSGFAVFGYGREVPEEHRAQEMPRAIEAGRALVRCVGALRAARGARRHGHSGETCVLHGRSRRCSTDGRPHAELPGVSM